MEKEIFANTPFFFTITKAAGFFSDESITLDVIT